MEAHWGWAGDAATPMESTAREAARIHERVPRNARLGLESRDWLEIFILVCMYFASCSLSMIAKLLIIKIEWKKPFYMVAIRRTRFK